MFNEQDIYLINNGLVDSRAKETAGNPLKTHSQAKMEMVYCIFCTKPKGWVTQDSYKYIKASNIVAVCDDCYATLGALPLPEAKINEVKI